MIDYYIFSQIQDWEQDLEREEENIREEIIQHVIDYSRAQLVYSKTLDENITIWLN
ncbi:MAG: hypothetical protein J6U84_00300 [Bacteroidales bacterium]|jgi:flagellar biosynthesis component FlhA|nr:hypothetical protein [Bacteroidales bacterium]